MTEQEKETLEAIKDYVDNFLETLPNVIDAFENEKINDIKVYTNPVIDGLQWILEATLAGDYLLKTSLSKKEMLENFHNLLIASNNKEYNKVSEILDFYIIPDLEEISYTLEDVLN